jgi:hypothetical protein
MNLSSFPVATYTSNPFSGLNPTPAQQPTRLNHLLSS